MQRGVKPQSTATRIATGSAAHDPQRVNHSEPVAPAGAPDKPDYLDEMASAAWDHVVGLFAEMGMLSRADGKLIEIYAVTYSGYRKALDGVTRTGQVLLSKSKNEDGSPGVKVSRNPYSTELHRYMDRLRMLLAEMGMTPSSRSRVSVNPTAKDDPFAEWLKAKRANLN